MKTFRQSLSLSLLVFCCTFNTNAQEIGLEPYTQYELLDPTTQSFRIIFDVASTTEGSPYYWNTLRKGSEHLIHEVTDLYSGKSLEWTVVDGKTALKNGLTDAGADEEYLQVKLARPVPKGGQARVRIDKTYKDPASYFKEGNTIVFSRSLGIQRNSLVLPAGYQLTECNYPVQVQLTDDARIKVSFMNRGSDAVNLVVKATPLPQGVQVKIPKEDPYVSARGTGPDLSKARLGWKFSERAFQDRDIVYFLQQPESHSFFLYHDYTESRPGMDRYLNVVRAGSKASKPSAIILDTGEELKVETLKGEDITKRGISIGEEVTSETEVVVIWYEPVKEGESKRLRISETYTDPARYVVYKDQLVWDRSFGRNRNTVVLPSGWFLTTSSIPAMISQNPEGLTTLRFINDRPDNIDVFIKAQRK